jgi:hypothetical protein
VEDSPAPAQRPPWSRRRRLLLLWLGFAVLVLGSGAFVLPAQYGTGSAALAGLAALLLLGAVAVFAAVPGPGTARTLLGSVTLGGCVLVVALLLVLSTSGQPLRPLWVLVAAAAAAWTGTAAWRARRARRTS